MIYTTQVLPDHVTDSQRVGPRRFWPGKTFSWAVCPCVLWYPTASYWDFRSNKIPGFPNRSTVSKHLGVLCVWILSFLKGPQLNPFTLLKCSHSGRPQRILFSIGNLTPLKPFHFAWKIFTPRMTPKVKLFTTPSSREDHFFLCVLHCQVS